MPIKVNFIRTPYLYRHLYRQTLPIDEELSAGDKRSREIERLCGLCTGVMIPSQSQIWPFKIIAKMRRKLPEK